MFPISNKHDLHLAYELLALAESRGKLEHIVEIKQAIRQYHNEPAPYKHLIRSDYDSYVELVELPEYVDSFELADEYFMDALFIEPTYSWYDCTGKPFTSHYKLFQRHNRWMAYHFVNYDV